MACPTSPSGAPLGQPGRVMPAGPGIPTPWIRSSTFSVSVEPRAPVEHGDAFAQAGPRRLGAAARAARGHARARFARDVPASEGAGERSQRVLRCATPYTRAAGPGRGERRLSRSRPGGHAVGPLARRPGLLAGAWPPLAAQQATGVVAHVTPKEGAARLPWWGICRRRKARALGGPKPCGSPGRRPAPRLPCRAATRTPAVPRRWRWPYGGMG
jgi:hypothetical protein